MLQALAQRQSNFSIELLPCSHGWKSRRQSDRQSDRQRCPNFRYRLPARPERGLWPIIACCFRFCHSPGMASFNPPLAHSELLQLKRWNTPTIYNGWEQITKHDRTRDAINLEEVRDFMPQMGPMVGYAVNLIVEP